MDACCRFFFEIVTSGPFLLSWRNIPDSPSVSPSAASPQQVTSGAEYPRQLISRHRGVDLSGSQFQTRTRSEEYNKNRPPYTANGDPPDVSVCSDCVDADTS